MLADYLLSFLIWFPIAGGVAQLIVMLVKIGDGFCQFIAKIGHLVIEVADGILADQPNARFGERQRTAFPIRNRSPTNRCDGFVSRMRRVE